MINHTEVSPKLQERLTLLQNHLIFSLLHTDTLKNLAGSLEDFIYQENSQINANNYSVEIIIEGSALLYPNDGNNKDEMIQIGEEYVLGLEKTRHFHDIKIKNAFFVTKTDLKVLRISVARLDEILNDHSQQSIAAMQKRFLQVYMIKQAKPFGKLKHDLLKKIISHIEEIIFETGDVVVQQNDVADYCYLLCDGKLEVSIVNTENKKRILAELEPVALFGESALTENSRRNATVIALTKSKVFRLPIQFFSELNYENISSYKTIFNLIARRSRPIAYPNVTVNPRLLSDKTEVFILKNQELNSYYQLTKNQLFIWGLLDGEHTITDITLAYKEKFEEITLDEISVFIVELAQGDFILSPQLKKYSDNSPKPLWIKGILLFKKIMECELAFKNIDPFITKIYQYGGFLIFKKASQFFLAALVIVGLFAFIAFFKKAETLLALPNTGFIYAALVPLGFFTVLIHELAHALTTKYFGHHVSYGGIGWFWICPIAFVDTSDMWLSTRAPRLYVNIAGIYSSLIVAGIAAIVALLVTNSMLALFFWLYSLYSYLCAIYNCDPIIELDGYYILMDLFDEPNLRQNATLWLVNGSKSLQSLRQNYQLVLYWMCCIAFLVVTVLLTLGVQFLVLKKALPTTIFYIPTIYLQWIATLVIIGTSFLSVYATLKSQMFNDIGDDSKN